MFSNTVLLRDLLAPATIGETSYERIVEVLLSQFSQKKNRYQARFIFNKRNRLTGEPFKTFYSTLKKLSTDCEFGQNLEERLVERIICGVNNEEVTRRLISEEDLKLDRCLTVMNSYEDVLQAQTGLMQRENSRVNYTASVARRPQLQPQHQDQHNGKLTPCFRCLGNHPADSCKYTEYTCFACGKKGHLQVTCRRFSAGNNRSRLNNLSRNSGPTWQPRNSPPGDSGLQQIHPSRRTHHITAADTETSWRNDHEQEQQQPQHTVELTTDEDYSDIQVRAAVCNSIKTPPEISVILKINDMDTSFQVDTGSDITILSEKDFKAMSASQRENVNYVFEGGPVKLRSYSGNSIENKGQLKVKVQYRGTVKYLKVVVAVATTRSLLGRDWLGEFKLDWNHLLQALYCNKVDNFDENIKSRFSSLFISDDSARAREPIRGIKVDIKVDPRVKVPFCKARKVPLALLSKTEEALDNLVKRGIISPVSDKDMDIEYCTPIVPILKSNGTVRICGSYDVTINKALSIDGYNMPIVEYELANLEGCRIFTKLDLKDAYTQLELTERSKRFTTINTHRGKFQANRLCYGISTAPGIFSEEITNMVNEEFRDRSGLALWYDDIVVGGVNQGEHDARLVKLLTLFEKYNVCLNEAKCVFATREVEFLGMRVSEDGISVCSKKLHMVEKATAPKDVAELRSFLGFINFLLKFIPNLAETTQPMSKLLKKDQCWEWGSKEQKSFEEIKRKVREASVLTPYSQKLPVHLMCDASPVAVGSCLFHVLPDNTRKPVGFASRVLTEVESRYSQFEREALGLIAGVKKFHPYLYGRRFTLWTDHKPLCSVFKLGRESSTVSPRVMRWAVALKAYEYELHHVAGPENFADWLSRYVKEPQAGERREMADLTPLEIRQTNVLLKELPVSADCWEAEQNKDPDIRQIREWLKNGWPEKNQISRSRMIYYKERLQLSLDAGCLWFGDRIVVPTTLLDDILWLLHETHSGVVNTKMIARRHFWFPQMNQRIEQMIGSCTTCQMAANAPPKTAMKSWTWPTAPWSRIHVDHFGPIDGKHVFVVVDSYSKWVDLSIHNTPTTRDCIKSLRSCFSIFGFPRTLVSDNGSCFTSTEFGQFCLQTGMKHLTCAAYNPKSNGQAERIVQCAKRVINKLSGNLQARTEKFVTQYRLTPNNTTGKSPNELMLNREIRGKMDILMPRKGRRPPGVEGEALPAGARVRVEKQQKAAEARYNQRAANREFQVGDAIFYRNFGQGEKWNQGVITRRHGLLMYELRARDRDTTASTREAEQGSGGQVVVRRHVDQLRKRPEQELAAVARNIPISVSMPPGPPTSPAAPVDEIECRTQRQPLREPYQLRSNK